MFNWFRRGRPLQLAISATCSAAFILFGYDQGVFSGIIGNQDFLDTFGHPNDTRMGIIVSSYNLGCFAGCVITFIVGDTLGRRRAMWLAMSLITIGATLQTTAYSVPHVIIARVVTGFGTGMETSTVPMYQSELCKPEYRGRIVATEPMFVGIGIVTAYWFDYGMNFISPTSSVASVAWRLPIAFQIAFTIIVGVLIFGVPESPRWLYQQHRDDEAIKVLCDVYDLQPGDPAIMRESEDIKEAMRLEEENSFQWRNLLQRDSVQTGRRVLLAWGMQFMNQVGGINLVVYYLPTALTDNVGVSRNLALILSGCINIMFPLGSLLPSFFLDQMGRRQPMMWCSLLLAVCMACIAALLSFRGTDVERPTAMASVAFFFLYQLIFGAGPNCIPWVYVPEILPLHARAKGTAIGISSNWIWNFTIVMITPIILNRLQWKAYLIFVVTNTLFVPLVYFFYPETTRLSLEEIDLLFLKHNAVKASLDRSWLVRHDIEATFREKEKASVE
ncbi:hexose carrier protein [Moniliophthora roreri MCA 2997]|uniref:Hexose carrier protein n=1 Tax=Moniliophthora roreri (strain MCA 2997) TaxID=1381753 RepID=V2XAD2_MONRO|nr:hexose carrier protein [Moniliophthora roreri MCA 2997]